MIVKFICKFCGKECDDDIFSGKVSHRTRCDKCKNDDNNRRNREARIKRSRIKRRG